MITRRRPDGRMSGLRDEGAAGRSMRSRDVPASQLVGVDPALLLGGQAVALAHHLGRVAGNRNVQRLLQPTVQRRLRVEEPTRALAGAPPRQVFEDYQSPLAQIAPGTTTLSDGSVLPGPRVPGRQGSKCVNDLSVAPTDWKLKLDDADGPHTEEGEKRVVIHSSRSIFEFGAWGGGPQAGQRTFADQSRVLAHELCGHAALMENGTHRGDSEVDVDGGRPGHDPTIKIENEIAAEIGGPGTAVRGSFADPHHGESFARVTVNGYPNGQTGVFSLPPEMRQRLSTVAAFMVKTRTTKADVMGHADRTGSAAVNEQVSRERAQNVRAFLNGQGVAASRFLVNVGKSFDECPAAPGGNPDCRRVEVFVFGHVAGSEGHA